MLKEGLLKNASSKEFELESAKMFSQPAPKSAKKSTQKAGPFGSGAKSPGVTTGGSHFKRKTIGNLNPNQLKKLGSELNISQSETDNLTQQNQGELKERLRASLRKNQDFKALL